MGTLGDDIELDKLVALDQKGLIVGRNESVSDFYERVDKILLAESDVLTRLGNDQAEEFNEIKFNQSDLIPAGLKSNAAARTGRFFGFDASDRIGFFAPKSIGFWWGGYALTDEDSGWTMFVLRREFRNHGQWLIYSRDEILAHEQCHAVRDVLQDPKLEEYFAYRTSSSGFRRYLGGGFTSSWDPAGLLGGLAVLLGVEFYNIVASVPIRLAPFIALALLYPVLVLLRNQYIRWVIARASAKLKREKFDFLPILFRMTFEEVKSLNRANSASEFLQQKAHEELRFQVICRRFAQELR